jgi:hypothetical protein
MIRRSGRGCRETPGPPVMSRGALVSAGRPRGESRGSEPGTHEVRVHVIQTGGRSRLDASRVLSAGRSQGLLAQHRSLAGKKLEALPDAGHEQKEGESVRGRALTIKSTRSFGLWVSARRLFNTTEGVLGLLPI